MKQLRSFFEWFAERAPVAQLHFIVNFMTSIEDTIGVRTNLKYFFSPIFGDTTLVGRGLSVCIRFIIIFCGLVIVGLLALVLILIPVVWLLSPLLAIVFPPFLIVPAFAILYYLIGARNQPAKLYPRDLTPERLSMYADKTTRDLLNKYLTGNFYRELESEISVSHFKERLLLSNIQFEKLLNAKPQKDFNLLFQEIKNLTERHRIRYIRPIHLFYALLYIYSDIFSHILLENKLDENILEKYLDWDEYENNFRNPAKIWEEDYKFHTGGGTNRTWQGTVTPLLNQFSIDITAQVKATYRPVVRPQLIVQIEQALQKSQNANVLLIGEIGVGKGTLIKQIAYAISYGGAQGPLWSKRIVQLDVGQLFASTKEQGAFETRMETIINEIMRSNNIILYLDDFNSCLQTTTVQGLNIFNLLQSPIEQGRLHIIGSITPKEFKAIENANSLFLREFTPISVPQTTKDETSHILHTDCLEIEEKHKLFFPYPSIDTIVTYSMSYMHEVAQPQGALNLLDEIAVYTENSHIAPTLNTIYGLRIPVTEQYIDQVVTKLTSVPVGPAQKGEAETLLKLEEKFQQHIVDQSEAVHAIAEVIRRNRSGIRNEHKPIGSFLFVGPTGVGKTEMAKTVAREYYGNENNMIRLDMSEFQTAESLERLIGYSGNTNSISSLTERVRKQPYSLVLLDELEKAHPKILDLFLQVLDDARLTDIQGTTIDFTETIIIATSNAATDEITKLFNTLTTPEQYKEIMSEVYDLLKPYYRVEFLNRFDQIILFKPLTPKSIDKIVRLQLSKLADRLYETKKIKVTFTENTIAQLIKTGYNKDLGVRPLEREIQNQVESKLAIMLLEGSVKEGYSLEI